MSPTPFDGTPRQRLLSIFEYVEHLIDAPRSPVFEPPYESPLEHDLAWHVHKHLAPEVKWEAQASVDTALGVFRLDFLATLPTGLRIGFECDGSKFHGGSRDCWRDAAIFAADRVDTIIRIRGADLWVVPHDILQLIASLHPALFTSRGRSVVARQASLTMLDYTASPNALEERYGVHHVLYPDEDVEFSPAVLERDESPRVADRPRGGRVFVFEWGQLPYTNYDWTLWGTHIVRNPGARLADLQAQFDKEINDALHR